jgi:hypothetical protein
MVILLSTKFQGSILLTERIESAVCGMAHQRFRSAEDQALAELYAAGLSHKNMVPSPELHAASRFHGDSGSLKRSLHVDPDDEVSLFRRVRVCIRPYSRPIFSGFSGTSPVGKGSVRSSVQEDKWRALFRTIRLGETADLAQLLPSQQPSRDHEKPAICQESTSMPHISHQIEHPIEPWRVVPRDASSRRRHSSTKHSQRFECGVCGASTTRRDNLMAHTRRKHRVI